MKLMNTRAHAKINLGLEILHRRPDGFHELNTIFIPIDWCDELSFKATDDDDIILTVRGAELPMDDRNLTIRAAKLLRSHAAVRDRGAEIELTKHIPIGAGLGGGSSDAAATLKALNELWGCKLTAEMLCELAAELGSDVPYFIEGGIALARGRGEELFPLTDSVVPYAILTIVPAVSISTAEAYSVIDRTRPRQPSDLHYALYEHLRNPELARLLFHNDFEEYLLPKYPVIEMIKEQLSSLGAVYTSLSGSGSAVYGLFPSDDDARQARMEFADFPANVTPKPVEESAPIVIRPS